MKLEHLISDKSRDSNFIWNKIPPDTAFMTSFDYIHHNPEPLHECMPLHGSLMGLLNPLSPALVLA